MLHNYFPPEKTGLVINLASNNKIIRKKSIEFIKNNIDLSLKLNSPIYSFHSGFCIDPIKKDLGQIQNKYKFIDKKIAIKNFHDSLFELLQYSKSKDIK